MNVIDHIREEHEIFKEKMSEIEEAESDTKRGLFIELYAEIYGHHEAEEAVVFPLVQEETDEEGMELVLEMIEEHTLGKHQFSMLEELPIDDETWDAKFMVLKEVLEHHIKEEEKELLPLAEKIIPGSTLEEILEKFETVNETKMSEQKKKLKS